MTSILVTRPAGPSDPLARRLAEVGYQVHAVPTVRIEPVGADSELDAALRSIDFYDWVVVTSASGVQVVADHLSALGRPIARLGSRPRWAAVGPATAEALRRHGTIADAIPPEGRGSAIVSALLATGSVTGRRFLLARAQLASGDLPDRLREVGALVDDVVAYRTIEGPSDSKGALAQALSDQDLAAIVFASGSAVRGLMALADHPDRVRDLPAVTIGGVTSGVARASGFRVAAEAASPTVDALLAAVDRIISTREARGQHDRPGDVRVQQGSDA